MKTTTIRNLLFTSSILFFSACSTTTSPKIKNSQKKTISPSLSAYNIIGIERGSALPTTAPTLALVKNPKKTFNLIQIIPEREPIEIINPYENSNELEDEVVLEESETLEESEALEELEEIEYVENIPSPIYNTPPSYINNSVNNNTPYVHSSIEVISYAPSHRENRNIYSPNIEVVSYGSRVSPRFPFSTHHTSKNSSVIEEEIESKAKSFLGTKYVWGATGPSKFDCSGFTQWVYRDSGITIPRVSRDQAKVGNYVTYENLRRGDMVFFDTKKHRQGVVTHVGIYLGNNNFIHASSAAKKVVIFNFEDKPFYKERFLWGRRVINTNSYLASK